MELSIEVKGYIQDVLATKIYAWEKIKTFGKRIGVETSSIERGRSKRQACEYILNNIPKDTAENVVSALVQMSKRGLWDHDYSKQILDEINPIMERTMNCKADDEGRITPIFPLLKQEPDLIVKELNSLGFAKTSSSYDQASKIYRSSPKGTLGLLRAAIDSLTEEMLTSKGITPSANFKDRLTQFSKLGTLMTLSTTECVTCHHRKQDLEFNYSYVLWGLLSHYGSHTGLVDDSLANFIYTSTSAFLWFLINRYKSRVSP